MNRFVWSVIALIGVHATGLAGNSAETDKTQSEEVKQVRAVCTRLIEALAACRTLPAPMRDKVLPTC